MKQRQQFPIHQSKFPKATQCVAVALAVVLVLVHLSCSKNLDKKPLTIEVSVAYQDEPAQSDSFLKQEFEGKNWWLSRSESLPIPPDKVERATYTLSRKDPVRPDVTILGQVAIRLEDEASIALREFTTSRVGQNIALVIDGKIILVGILGAPITHLTVGDHDESLLELVDSLRRTGIQVDQSAGSTPDKDTTEK